MSRSNPLPQTERRDSLARSSHPTLRHGRDGSGGAPTWSALGSALATIAMLLSADVACAQAWQREATELVSAGRESDALERLELAETRDVRDRAELVSLYATRAELREALGDHDGARADLRRLAALDPERALRDGASLPLRRALDEERAAVGGALAIEVSVQRFEDHARVHVEARHAPADLELGVRVRARGAGAEWQLSRGADVEVQVAALDALELAIELVGPRDLVLAARGTTERPEVFEGDASAVLAPSSGSDDTTVGWIVGVSVGVLVLTAAVLGIAATVGAQGSDHTALDGPTVRF